MIKANGKYGYLTLMLALLSTLVACTPILAKPMCFVVLGVCIGAFILPHIWIVSKQLQVTIIGMFLYVLLTASYRIMGMSDGIWGNSMHEYFFLLTFFLGIELTRLDYERQKKIYWLILVIIGINILYNIYISSIYPEFFTNSREDIGEELLQSLNVGGSTFFTMSMFFFNVCFFVFLNTDVKVIRIGSLLFCLLALVFVLFCSQKGSNIVYLLLSIPLQLYAKHTKRISSFVVSTIFISLFALLLLMLFKDAIIQMIIDMAPSERVSVRLITLLDKKNSMADDDVVSGRTELYFLSLKTWLSNPVNFLIGIGDNISVYDVVSTGIGRHSDLFDTLARYGLIGGLILFATIKRYYSYIISLFDKKYKIQLLVICVIFVLCASTKGVLVPEVGCVLFILLPISSVFMKKKKTTEYKKR